MLMKKILIGLIFLLIAVFFTKSVLAQYPVSSLPSSSPTSLELSQQVNSYELFWPLTAGRTVDDSLYSLKLFKEKIRGWLIFGIQQKADYAAMLTTKRVLEAEKLINENKTNLVGQTFNMASSQLDIVNDQLKMAKQKNEKMGQTATDLSNKLNNLEKFLNNLLNNKPEYQTQIKNLLEKIQSAKNNL